MHHLTSSLLDLEFEELVAEVNLTSGQLAFVQVAIVTRGTCAVSLDPLAPFLNRVKA